MELNPRALRLTALSQHVGKELALDRLAQMGKLVHGSNVIGDLQAKLYGFHRSVFCGLAGGLVER